MELGKLIAEYDEALINDDYDKIHDIISRINREPSTFKVIALEFYEKINQDLFQRGRSANNYDIERFRDSIKKRSLGKDTSPGISIENVRTVAPLGRSYDVINGKESKSTDGLDVESPANAATVIEAPEEKYSFDQIFLDFYNRHSDIFSRLKDFHIFQLENGGCDKPPNLLILCDSESANNPLINRLVATEQTLATDKILLEDFNKTEEVQAEKSLFNYIGVVCLAPKLVDHDFRQKLEVLFSLFEVNNIISIKSLEPSISIEDIDIDTVNPDIINNLQHHSNKVFSNKKLSFNEQKIIKKFFGRYPGIIDYRVINEGSSGAIVIEVQHNRINMNNTKRFVIKIAPKRKEALNKLQREKENFDEYVKGVPTTTAYSADYIQTDVLEAIQYNYASSDGITETYSFKDLLNAFAADKIPYEKLESTLSNLLQCDLLMEGWKTPTPEKIKNSCGELYNAYLNHEEESIAAIKKIENRDISTSTLILNYKSIKSSTIETNEKICHGDLHSENFFCDDNKVYLIDFGFTQPHHAVVDHAFLEASIRLKHFPRYISIGELIEYDEAFLDLKSFKPGFDLGFIRREKVRELYRLIYQLRMDSLQYVHNQNSPVEYLISLFMITFRLIQYADLNQLYALRLSELLSATIVPLTATNGQN